MGGLIGCAIALATMFGAPYATGRVTYYQSGVFRQVANNRGMPLYERYAGYRIAGYVSTRRCERVDTRSDPTLRTRPWLVSARINGGALQVYQVVDCSDPRDLPDHIRRDLILEVDKATADTHRIDPTNNRVVIYRIWRP